MVRRDTGRSISKGRCNEEARVYRRIRYGHGQHGRARAGTDRTTAGVRVNLHRPGGWAVVGRCDRARTPARTVAAS